jgi:hypothetical protein
MMREPRGKEGCASFALPEWGAASTFFSSRSFSARRQLFPSGKILPFEDTEVRTGFDGFLQR